MNSWAKKIGIANDLIFSKPHVIPQDLNCGCSPIFDDLPTSFNPLSLAMVVFEVTMKYTRLHSLMHSGQMYVLLDIGLFQ